jgi:hypothetical protein
MMATSNNPAFVKLTHVASAAEQLDQVAAMVTTMVSAGQQRATAYAKLAARKLTADETKAYVEDVLKVQGAVNPVMERRIETILELNVSGKGVEFAPGTAWSAFNAVTEYIDHVRPAEAKAALTIANANQSALFGANAQVKQRALVLATRLAA